MASRRSSILRDDPRTFLSDEAIKRLDHAIQGYHERHYRALAIVKEELKGAYFSEHTGPKIAEAQIDGAHEYMFAYVREFHAIGKMGGELYQLALNELEGCSSSWELNDIQRRTVEVAIHKEIYFGEFSNPPVASTRKSNRSNASTTSQSNLQTKGTRKEPMSPEEFARLIANDDGTKKTTVLYRVAAQILGVGDRQVRNLVTEEKLQAIGPPQRRRISVASLKAHLGY